MYKFIVSSVVIFALIGSIKANINVDVDALKSQFIPAEYLRMNFTAEETKRILKEKCQKVSGNNETTYIQAYNGSLKFLKCVSKIGNLTEIQEEIELAKPIGELDTVFQKYCKKQEEVKTCFNNFMPNILPCLNKEERQRQSFIVDLTTKLLGFVCNKGGDQIALFYAEQGPECLEENKENINFCLNASFAQYIPKNSVPDIFTLSQASFSKSECKDIQDFEKCVQFHLKKCNDITPLNIIESIFKFVNNETKCDSTPKLASINAKSLGTKIKSVLNNYFLILIILIIIY